MLVAGCSVRDLMRRKRCYRVEPAESETQRVKKTSSVEENKEDLCLYPRRLEFHTLQNDGQDKRPLECADSWSSLTGRLPEFNEGNPRLATSALKGCAEAHDVKSTNSNYSMHVCKPNTHIQMSKFDTDDKLLDNEILLQKNDSAAIHCSTSVESEILGSDGYICKNGYESRTFMQTVPEMSSENLEGMKTTTDATVLQFENCGEHHRKATSLSGTGSSVLSIFNLEANPVELIGMTFHQKPPKVDSADGTFENASLSVAVPNRASFGDMENYEGISVRGTVVDEFLPFFMGDSLEEIQNKSHRNNDFDHRQEAAMGVPTHYQNDGSYLYILTPAFSPPSADSVSAWLLHDDAGICGDKFDAASMEPSSPNGSSGSQISSRGSLPDACKKPFLESGSISEVKPILDQLNQPPHGNFNAQINPSHNEATTTLQNERNVIEVKECTDHTQDISQISGPDGKSKPTPLSQIGFRDPASVGGGQQLTLLSIEVQAESRGDLRPDPRFDAINVIVLAIQEDNDDFFDIYVLLRSKSEHALRNLDGISGCKVLVSSEEKHLFNHFINIVCTVDPDILMGWDIQGSSLGFLAERASYIGIGLLNNISRTPSETKIAAVDSDVPARGVSDIVCPEPLSADFVPLEDAVIEDEWGRTHGSGVHVGGRIVLNIWRLMRGEVKLNMYTVEAVGEAVLRRKIPSLHSKVLTKWLSSGPGKARYRCIEYVVEKAKLNLEIMNQLDMINRTSELAASIWHRLFLCSFSRFTVSCRIYATEIGTYTKLSCHFSREATGCFSTCNGVPTSCNGARIGFLFRSSCCFGFSVTLSINDNCIQPMLLYMPRKCYTFEGKYTWC
ncbi:hypothetical protein F0562_019981 [Nyssa sinensis]|uniref:DNA-directed DNA polymerase family B exonuclease domain-containing protein n=1 Tax=Nyssa sinensis TaxID=561372 RepID=A0A5J5BSS0_9ASTE|nr:hypothetical protein F0562_019981 [Nyssa sinensis]